MSTEFNPMEGLLADLLSTWDEEPFEGAEGPESAETRPEATQAEPQAQAEVSPELFTSPSPQSLDDSPVSPDEPPVAQPVTQPVAVPFISALLKPVIREPIFLDTAPAVPEPPAPDAQPTAVAPIVAIAEPASELIDAPPIVEAPVALVRTWTADPGAAAACAAILARMEREFAEREPITLPARKTRLGSDAPRFVVFVVRDMMFAVPIGRVLETDRMTPVTPLPGAATGVKGLTNLRGEVVPVIDLREVLGWAPIENPTLRRMLVIQDGNRQPLTALLVDQVKGLAAIPVTAWKSAEMAGAHSAEGYVEAVAERDREWVSRLNLDRVLNETHLPSLAAA